MLIFIMIIIILSILLILIVLVILMIITIAIATKAALLQHRRGPPRVVRPGPAHM